MGLSTSRSLTYWRTVVLQGQTWIKWILIRCRLHPGLPLYKARGIVLCQGAVPYIGRMQGIEARTCRLFLPHSIRGCTNGSVVSCQQDPVTTFPPLEEHTRCLEDWLLQQFSDKTFNSMKPLPVMQGKPFLFHILPNAIQHACHTLVSISKHWEDYLRAWLDKDLTKHHQLLSYKGTHGA